MQIFLFFENGDLFLRSRPSTLNFKTMEFVRLRVNEKEAFSKSLLWDRCLKTCNFSAQKHRFLVDAKLSGEKMLRFHKYPDTSGRSLNVIFQVIYNLFATQ